MRPATSRTISRLERINRPVAGPSGVFTTWVLPHQASEVVQLPAVQPLDFLRQHDYVCACRRVLQNLHPFRSTKTTAKRLTFFSELSATPDELVHPL